MKCLHRSVVDFKWQIYRDFNNILNEEDIDFSKIFWVIVTNAIAQKTFSKLFVMGQNEILAL